MHMKATLAVATALLQSTNGYPRIQTRIDEPCKQVKDAVDAWILENGIVPRNLTRIERLLIPELPAAPIRPSLAYSCLKSVPLQKESALAQLDFLRPLFQWQSTVDYLQDPPQGYLSEGVDLIGGLDDIAAKLNKTTSYKTEFEFLSDLYTLTSVRVRDAHFIYNTLLMDIFTFELGVQFISISKNGVTKPEVYLYDDLHHDKHGYTPSSVSTIDGIPAHAFLQKASVKVGSSHDPDARLNKMLPSVANDGTLIHLAATPFSLDLPDTTTVHLQNGTKLAFNNTAWFRANFTNISSGADLYEQFGQGNGTESQPHSWAMYKFTDMNFTSPLKGFPAPLSRTKSGTVAGFLFNNTTNSDPLSDTAILFVNSFTTLAHPTEIAAFEPGFAYNEFYNITTDLLHSALAANKTKLIIDLQGNGGGQFYALNSLYLSLFPNQAETLPLLYQLRVHPQLEWYGTELFNASNPTQLPANLENLFVKPAAPNSWSSNGTLWPSFQEFYGPVDGAGGRGKYTRASAQNSYDYMHNPPAWDFTPPFEKPPFKPENIVIVTDGECASACAVLVDILVNIHGVRTVAMGGRPIEAPMQAIGEVKGGPVSGFWNWPEVDRSRVPEGLEVVPSVRNSTPPLRIAGEAFRGDWGSGVSFNLANIVPFDAPNEGDGAMPYQFLYEAANCKLFFTWEMARDIVALWRAVAEVTWGGGECVRGSTTRGDGRMGGRVEYSEGAEDEYRLGEGPGALGR